MGLNLSVLKVLCACNDAIYICDGIDGVEFLRTGDSLTERFMFNHIMHEVESGNHGEILSEEDYINAKCAFIRNNKMRKSAVVQQAQAWFDTH